MGRKPGTALIACEAGLLAEPSSDPIVWRGVKLRDSALYPTVPTLSQTYAQYINISIGQYRSEYALRAPGKQEHIFNPDLCTYIRPSQFHKHQSEIPGPRTK